MKTKSMSFMNVKDILSRDEMKGIMAGAGSCTNCIKGGVSYACGSVGGPRGTVCSCSVAFPTTNNC